jgi:hypothetical protein
MILILVIYIVARKNLDCSLALIRFKSLHHITGLCQLFAAGRAYAFTPLSAQYKICPRYRFFSSHRRYNFLINLDLVAMAAIER